MAELWATHDNAARRPSGGRAAGWGFAGYALGPGRLFPLRNGTSWSACLPSRADPGAGRLRFPW